MKAKWYRHKEHSNAVAKLYNLGSCHRLVFYWIVNDLYERRDHEEVTKMFYLDPQEARNALFNLGYEEDV